MKLTTLMATFFRQNMQLSTDNQLQGGTSVVVPYCSCCLYLYFGSAIMLVTYFVKFR